MQTQHNRGESVEELGTLLAQDSRLRICRGGIELFKRFRVTAPELVSSASSGTNLQVFLLEYDGKPLGGTTFYVQANDKRKHHENLWARIDLVVVLKTYRRMGVARAVVLCVLVYMTKVYGDRLYSISCLAAHKAIERILRDLQFVTKPVGDKEYVHQELRVTKNSCKEILRLLNSEAEKALRVVSYRFRQEQGKKETFCE